MKERYPFNTFPGLWSQLDTLIKSNRLISPQQVYEELQKWDDEVFRWVNQCRKLFKPLDNEQTAVAKEILEKFPSLIDPQKETADADPFVISLAKVKTKNLTLLGDECIVVSQEKPGSGIRAKIPDVCSNFAVKHFSSIEFFNNEGWKFYLRN